MSKRQINITNLQTEVSADEAFADTAVIQSLAALIQKKQMKCQMFTNLPRAYCSPVGQVTMMCGWCGLLLTKQTRWSTNNSSK